MLFCSTNDTDKSWKEKAKKRSQELKKIKKQLKEVTKSRNKLKDSVKEIKEHNRWLETELKKN